MNRFNSRISTILPLITVFVMMLSCSIGQTEEQTTLFDQYYTIKPSSLIESLKSGDLKAFSPVNQQFPVEWLQADYFYSANTLYESVLGSPLQGWQLKGMDFQLSCAQVHHGFQNGRLEFFKVVKEKEQESRIIRFIDVDPRGNFVHAKEWEFFPNLSNLEAIDLAQLEISADLALQIAESNGGEEKRQSIENACDISLGLYPNSSSYKGWEVIYTRSDDRTSFFHIQIDPISGEIYLP